MKSYDDELPNISKEEITRAATVAQEAVDVSKATLATTADMLEISNKNLRAVKFNTALLLVNLAISAANAVGWIWLVFW